MRRACAYAPWKGKIFLIRPDNFNGRRRHMGNAKRAGAANPAAGGLNAAVAPMFPLKTARTVCKPKLILFIFKNH